MTTKRHYEKPVMQVFELKQQPQLLAGSTTAINFEGAGIDDYEDPTTPFSW